MSEFEVEATMRATADGLPPIDRWDWNVTHSGEPVLEGFWGGTGACWNLASGAEQEHDCAVHVCDLDDLIADLVTLASVLLGPLGVSLASAGQSWVRHGERQWWLALPQGPDGTEYPPTLVADVSDDKGIDLWSYSNGDWPGDEDADPSRLCIADLPVMIGAVRALRASEGDRLNHERWGYEWEAPGGA